jgi:hypothetical protein
MPVGFFQKFYIALNFYVSAPRDIILIGGLHSLINLWPIGVIAAVKDSLPE